MLGLGQQVYTQFIPRGTIFLIRAVDGLVYAAVADGNDDPEVPLELDMLVCWSKNVLLGQRCRKADSCKCGQDFRPKAYYCLQLGTLRVKISSKVPLIRNFRWYSGG